jgi:putative iron-regulated protein
MYFPLLLLASYSLAAADPQALQEAAVRTHAKTALAAYTDALDGAVLLQEKVRAFLEKPDATGLDAARKAWIAARKPYIQTEALRFSGGPIDDDDGIEHALNAWPLDESFIEKVPGAVEPGIIENEKDYPEISSKLLERLNETTGEKNLTCGYHVIEFLLWGQDTSSTGPGNRSFEDYSTAPQAKRRGQFLKAACAKLVADLRYVADDWSEGKLGNYRAMFEEGVEDSLRRMVMGLTLLCEFELAGSRLQVPYDLQEQEEEHSCFSDTTHLDTQWNVAGVANVWNGIYRKTNGSVVEGTSLRLVAEKVAPALAAEISKRILVCQGLAAKFPPPFDQAILGDDDSPGRKALKELIITLEDLGQSFRKLGGILGAEIPTDPTTITE